MKRHEEEGLIITKIVTYDGMYYTLNEHTREQVLDIMERRKDCDIKLTEGETIEDLIREDLCNIITSKDDIIWLPYENKLINKKEIKESLVQFK